MHICVYRYITNGWEAMSQVEEMKRAQMEELQNAMDVVGFEANVS